MFLGERRDYVHMKQVARLIGKLAEAGKIIFIVSHDLDLLLSTCDGVLLTKKANIEKTPYMVSIIHSGLHIC